VAGRLRDFSDLQRIAAFILLVLAVSALYSFVSTLSFTNTGLPGIVGVGGYRGHSNPLHPVPASFTQSSMSNLSSLSNPAKVPIYFVEGLNDYTYLMRLYTSAYYDPAKHAWIEETSAPGKEKPPATYTVKYKVTPIVTLKDHIPVSQKTVFVTLKNAVYYPKTSTYGVKEDRKPYVAYSIATPPRATAAAKLPADSPYLQVNCYGKERIRELALKVTKGAKNDFEKAERIAEFLETNYTYGFTTYGNDPIYQFLFVKKVGICKHFASAFVMMCRSIGLPARMVFGYKARPEPYNQTVFSSQAHAWAEVLFTSGWVEFDPTPSQKKIPTETDITHVSKEVYVGQNLTVSGIVKITDKNYTYLQNDVSGYVEIYLAKNKNDRNTYKFLGIFPVKAGKFNASVKVNRTGKYHVLAHYTGSLMFYSSWSDPVVEILGKPYIEANIGKLVVAGDCTIKGRVVYGRPVNGTIYLYVDGKEYSEPFNTTFEFRVYLAKGKHRIKIYYPGSKEYFISSAVLEKTVEAGDVRVLFSNTTAIAGKEWITNVTVLFNGIPVREVVYLGYPFYVNVTSGVNISLPAPREAGVYAVNYSINSMGYTGVFRLYVKSPTKIEAEIRGDMLILRVVDSSGKPVKGFVFVNGKRYYDSGVLKVKLNESKAKIYYPGDDIHLPSRAEVSKPLPFWVYLIPLPLLFLIAMKFRRKRTLRFDYTPPPVWLPGDEVRIGARGEGIVRLSVDGERAGFGEGFCEYTGNPGVGEHLLEAEVVNEKGKVVERGKLEFFVLPFWRALAKVFEEVVEFCEKRAGRSMKDATAREVLDALGVDEELRREILSFFEPNRYGDREEGSREDLVEFYRLCRKVIEEGREEAERISFGKLCLRRCSKC